MFSINIIFSFLGLGTLSAFEEEMMKAGLPDLIKQINKGIEFVAKNY